MAAFSLNSLPFPPSKPRIVAECSESNKGLKPIVVRGNPPTFVSAPGRRIVAVGDLHGDLAQTRSALEMAGVLSSSGHALWTGGDTILVQLGDILDRGEDEIAILSLLKSLNLQAKSKGGAVFQVDDWVFCHGGLLPHHVAYGVERMNTEVADWMQGFVEDSDTPDIPFIAIRGYDSVVWNRLYSRESAQLKYQACQISSVVEETLQAMGAKGMVVGHTPQSDGVNCKYNCKVWCIDVGMSSGVLNSRPEVLEIVDNKARVLRNQRDYFNERELMDYL